jgi:hypothetical protein
MFRQQYIHVTLLHYIRGALFSALYRVKWRLSRLGGVKVNVTATGPKGRGFKPGRGDEYLRAIKFRSTPSFGWEVKPEVPCRKI